MKKSDVVSLHCPLFPETEGLINTERLKLMKRSAFLINASRGPLVKDQDLANALNDGVIAGAALDVLSVEPPQEKNPLLSARNCLVTPHIAWATLEACSRLMAIAVSNVAAYLQGETAKRGESVTFSSLSLTGWLLPERRSHLDANFTESLCCFVWWSGHSVRA
ncbi:MAG: NAD(P)-dependent oxidoreductase [Terriglobia bacterium]